MVAPGLLAGGWPLEVLPITAILAGTAWFVATWRRWSSDRGVAIPMVSLVLGLLSLFTMLQALPGLGGLGFLSPRAAEMHTFVGVSAPALGYEVGAAWREAAKMLVYALVAASAHAVARRRGGRPVLETIVAASLASVIVALVHRGMRLDALWGHFEGARSAAEITTTYQNPNHASALLGLGTLVAAGLGVDAQKRAVRVAYLCVAAALAAASMVEPSKGGVLSLLVGLGIFGVGLWLKSRSSGDGLGLPILFAALLLPLVGLVWQLDAVMREFGLGADGATLGLGEKLAAMQNAWPIVWDHPWVGIGRGSYISVYPHYQTSGLQLTFAFPENLLAQLTSEWGVLVGGAAFFGLVAAIGLRLVRARRAHELGALAGAAALLVHDMVDFSLEMPGIAVLLAALLGATTPIRASRGREAGVRLRLKGRTGWGPIQLHLRRGGTSALLASAPVGLLALYTLLALGGGDVRADVEWMRAHADQVASEAVALDEPEVARRSERHPTNVLMATQLAYLREVQRPRDLPGALEAVNRALFLGPKYADAHILAGRLLLRGGHRRQAMEELRTAWRLTRSRADVVYTATRWARSPEELLQAIPRSDVLEDRLAVPETCRLARLLVSQKRAEWAVAVIEQLPPVASMSLLELQELSRTALIAGLSELALNAARRGAELRPNDATLALTLARLARRAGRLEEARQLAADIDPEDVGAETLYEFRFTMAIEAGDGREARRLLDELRRALPLSRETQTELSLREARLHLAEGRPDRAVSVLGKAIDWSPSHVEVRMLRGVAFERLGRVVEARADAEAVLRRQPGHPGARALMARARAGTVPD